MTSFGVLTTGFSTKSLATILQEIEDKQRSLLGDGINTTSTSVLGQLNGIFSERLSELWQVALAVYSSQYIDSAIGASLDQLVGLLGLTRLAKSKTTINVVLNLGAGVTVPAGSLISDSTTNAEYRLTAAATNGAGFPANITVGTKAEVFGSATSNPRALNTILSPIVGWDPSIAVNTTNVEPFSIGGGDTLFVKVDGGAPQTVTFVGGDTTAALVATRITAGLTGATAAAAGTAVRVTNSSDTPGNSLEFTGGTALPALNFPSGLFQGFNPSHTAANLISANTQPFALSGTETLTIKVDSQTTAQTITFQAGDFAIGGAATAIEVARRINLELTAPAGTAVALSTGTVQIRSANNLSTSALEVTGGTANAVLSFSTTKVLGTKIDSLSPGRNEETDTELRTRFLASTAGAGAGPLASIQSNVRNVTGVTAVAALENVTDAVDGNGLPGHSFELITQGGVDQDIRNAILAKKPAGIEAFGTVSGTATDSEGNTITIKFSRPTIVDLYIDLTLEFVAAEYPADGDDQVKNALIAEVKKLVIGKDVVSLPIKCSPLVIGGVRNVSVFEIATTPAPASDPGKITIQPRELAQLLSANINITKTAFTDLP